MDIKIEKKGIIRRRHLPYIVGGGVVAAALAALVVGNFGGALTVERRGVAIGSVKRDVFNDFVRTDGQVQPIRVVQLSPEEGGIVQEKVAEEGARVKRGDVLVRLSNSTLDLSILNAEAELAEKQNFLRNTEISMEQDRLSNLNELAQLDYDLIRRRRAYEQMQRLSDEALVPREDYLQAREDYELVQRRHSLVAQRLRQDSLYRQTQIGQLRDDLDNMRRNVLLIRERKEHLTIRSTIDGEVGLLDVELGQSISSGQKIGQVNDLSDYKVEAKIDEHYIDRVRQGLEASLERGGEAYRLVVRKVYPEVRDGLFRTELVFDGKRPDNIRSGQTYYLDLQLGRADSAVVIPRGTFFAVTGGSWIFVLDKDGRKAYRRSIRIGRQNPEYYEVLEGLDEGEAVIISGYEAYRNNDVLVLK